MREKERRGGDWCVRGFNLDCSCIVSIFFMEGDSYPLILS